jgi:hypothetical protein
MELKKLKDDIQMKQLEELVDTIATPAIEDVP